MKKFKDLTGRRFGRLVAMQRRYFPGCTPAYKWECLCDCGNTSFVSASNLLKVGGVRSCGCLRSTPNKIYSIGDVSICIMQGSKTSGYFWFDTEDLELILSYQWHADNLGYAVAYSRGAPALKNGSIRATKLLLGLPYGFDASTVIDHINGDICDNRKCNLRVCTMGENTRHKRNVQGYSKTRSARYGAHIVANGEYFWLGTYDTPEEAAAAYKAASILYHKEFGAHDGYIYYPGCPHE